MLCHTPENAMKRLFAILFALAAACAAATVAGQDYPQRPVRMIVGQPPGGTTDIIARFVAAKLSERWGQQVVVDNRAGASGIIGADLVAKSQPDGYTLFMAAGSFGPISSLYAKLPFDVTRDFAPIDNVIVMVPHIKSGALRGLAVTSARRSPVIPDLPTIAESAVPDFQSTGWFGIFAAAKTPPALVNKINADASAIMQQADVRERLLAQGAEPASGPPDDLRKHLAREIAVWGKVIRDAGVTME